MRVPSRTEWGQSGNPRGAPDYDTRQHSHQATVNTSHPEKSSRTLEEFLKSCSLTFQVQEPSQQNAAGIRGASFQQWPPLW